MIEVLRAIQQADSAFPSGGFAFSQGLEGWVAELGRPDASHLRWFIVQQISLRWATADRVALLRAHESAGCVDALAEVDRGFERTQVVAVLREGSRRNGRALLAAHTRMGTRVAAEIEEAVRAGRMVAHLPVVQGAVWRAVGIGADLAAVVGGYICASGLIAAAVRLNVIGAIRGQEILADLLDEIAVAANEPVRTDSPIASFHPFAEVAAMRGAAAGGGLFSN